MIKLRYSFSIIEKFIKDKVGDYKITPSGEIAINSLTMDDTTYDCHISVDKQCWMDWEAGEGGALDTLIADIAKIEPEEVPGFMLKYGSAQLSDYTHEKKPLVVDIKPISFPPGSYTFNKSDKRGSVYNSNLARRFLAEKLVNYSIAKKYDLRWTDMSLIKIGEKRVNINNRIIIPSYEEGNLVYFQARDYTGKSNLRYVNPPKEIQQKSIVIPFYDQIIEEQPIFISEGPWEAIQYSGTYMLGPMLSDRQVYKLKKKKPTSVYFIPDNDETGRRKLVGNINSICRFMDIPIYIIKWWSGKEEFKDPIDAGITPNDLLASEIIKADRNIDLKIKMGMI